MKKLLLALAVTCLALLLQTTAFARLAPYVFGVVPDLSMIFLLFFSMNFGRIRGQITGFFVGLVKDMLSSSVLGYYALVGMIIGSLAGSLKDRLFLESYPTAITIVLIATFIKHLLSALVATFFSIEGTGVDILSLTFLFELIINGLMAAPIFAIVKFITKKMSYFWQWERSDR